MLFLFAAACLGHLVFMVASHNWFYGLPLPRRVMDLIHLLHGALTVAFPVLLWGAAGWDLSGLFRFDTAGGVVLAAYVVSCWAGIFVLLPLNIGLRLLRLKPAALGKEQSEVVDVVKQLGGWPAGAGCKRFQAALPFNEALTATFVERTLHLPRLPAAWEGLSVLHLSDLHLSGTPDRSWFRAVMDRCAAWEPDIVAVTGDLADGDEYLRWIVPVLGKLRWKIAAFAILGNHDAWYQPNKVRRRLRRLGMRVLGNGWEQIEVRGEPMIVIGQEWPWFKPAPDLAGCPVGPFRLCLSHTPDNIRWAQRAGVDLMLSGHVHGGQIRMPLIGSIFVPSRYGRRYDCGVFDEPPTLLHVSRGLGGDHPLRFRCRPEATRLILRRPFGLDSGARPGVYNDAMRDAVQEYIEFNRPFARRNPELLRFKVARMAESPFAFFRGTFHIFARDLLDKTFESLTLFSRSDPELDIVGDIHSENYGSFKAKDEVVHYDVNDFDETTTGRFDFDVCRAAVSWFLAARERDGMMDESVRSTLAAVAAYAEALRRAVKKGKAPDRDVSENSPAGCEAVDAVVRAGAAAKRPPFVERLTEQTDKGRRLLRSPRYFNLPDEERVRAERLLADYLRRRPAWQNKDYYTVEDVCGRVSGIGSMGRLRYVVLISGKSSKDGRNVLLEFKEARPSAYDLYRNRDTDGAALEARAERVIAMQRLSQAASNGHLGFAIDGGASFQAREVGPADARVETRTLRTAEDMAGVARVQAQILARVHARAALRAVGPANPLAELADADVFCQRVLGFALGYADVVRRDWSRFVGARADLDNISGWADR